MGKGDKKTAKGKRVRGSYGVSRKRKESVSNSITPVVVKEEKVTKTKAAPKAKKTDDADTVKKAAPKKAASKKASIAKKETNE